MSIDVSNIINNVANGTDTSDEAKQQIVNAYVQNQSTSSSNSLLNVANNQSLSSVTTNLTSSVSPTLTSAVTSVSSLINGNSTNSTKMNSQSDRRIKLRPKSGTSSFIKNSILLAPLATTNGLIFPYTPRITINHQAVYGTQRTTHANQDFRYYTNTPALSFQIVGDFTAQNQQEGLYMLGVFHFISTLTKMHSGGITNDVGLGLPPPMLLLSGFGPYVFNDLPVILTSGSYSYDPSVDLVEVIVNNVSNDVPSLCTVSIEVTVQLTPEKLRTFNWDSFASGQLLSSGGWK